MNTHSLSSHNAPLPLEKSDFQHLGQQQQYTPQIDSSNELFLDTRTRQQHSKNNNDFQQRLYESLTDHHMDTDNEPWINSCLVLSNHQLTTEIMNMDSDTQTILPDSPDTCTKGNQTDTDIVSQHVGNIRTEDGLISSDIEDFELTDRTHQKKKKKKYKWDILYCRDCLFKTTDWRKLHQHAVDEHNDISYYCQYCINSFPSYRSMQNHVSKVHQDIKGLGIDKSLYSVRFSWMQSYVPLLRIKDRQPFEPLRQYYDLIRNKRDHVEHILATTNSDIATSTIEEIQLLVLDSKKRFQVSHIQCHTCQVSSTSMIEDKSQSYTLANMTNYAAECQVFIAHQDQLIAQLIDRVQRLQNELNIQKEYLPRINASSLNAQTSVLKTPELKVNTDPLSFQQQQHHDSEPSSEAPYPDGYNQQSDTDDTNMTTSVEDHTYTNVL